MQNTSRKTQREAQNKSARYEISTITYNIQQIKNSRKGKQQNFKVYHDIPSKHLHLQEKHVKFWISCDKQLYNQDSHRTKTQATWEITQQ